MQTYKLARYVVIGDDLKIYGKCFHVSEIDKEETGKHIRIIFKDHHLRMSYATHEDAIVDIWVCKKP